MHLCPESAQCAVIWRFRDCDRRSLDPKAKPPGAFAVRFWRLRRYHYPRFFSRFRDRLTTAFCCAVPHFSARIGWVPEAVCLCDGITTTGGPPHTACAELHHAPRCHVGRHRQASTTTRSKGLMRKSAHALAETSCSPGKFGIVVVVAESLQPSFVFFTQPK